MVRRKAILYTMLFIFLTACMKQEITPVQQQPASALISTSNNSQLSIITPTVFGLMNEDASDDETRADMSEAGVNIVRLTIFLSETFDDKTIDSYLTQGYNVEISVSWYTGVNGTRGFPTDTNAVKSQANAFFQYYAAHKNQIPFVSIENEWDYEVQYGANLQSYLKELSIMTTAGHKYGFKIADGGITSGALQRWIYSQLAGTAQDQWKDNYYVGLNNNYNALMNIVNTYIASAKNINFDYSNVHWYNTIICNNGYSTASKTFMTACNKKTSVCNEFGIRANSLTLFTQTVAEITGNALYAIAYSGTNQKGKAIKLTDAMLHVL
jgi:hypothetical protein